MRATLTNRAWRFSSSNFFAIYCSLLVQRNPRTKLIAAAEDYTVAVIATIWWNHWKHLYFNNGKDSTRLSVDLPEILNKALPVALRWGEGRVARVETSAVTHLCIVEA